jgi:cytochrome c biogenesis protein CcmG, thiol:disulfide interchange protein DsbE
MMMNDIVRRHWNLFSVFILAACLLWIGVTASMTPITTQGLIPAPKTGFKAPDFTLTTLEGKDISLAQYQGKVVVLNIWTTWCAFCETEMPAFQNVAQEMSDSTGVVILAINSTSQDDLDSVAQFVQRKGLTFPIPMDSAGRVTRLYQVRALPTTFFIGPDGIIRNMIIGGPITESLIKSQVNAILEEVH